MDPEQFQKFKVEMGKDIEEVAVRFDAFLQKWNARQAEVESLTKEHDKEMEKVCERLSQLLDGY